MMINKRKTEMIMYPASRGFTLAWLLAFTKSFALLVSRIVGLFYTPPASRVMMMMMMMMMFVMMVMSKRTTKIMMMMKMAIMMTMIMMATT